MNKKHPTSYGLKVYFTHPNGEISIYYHYYPTAMDRVLADNTLTNHFGLKPIKL